MLSCGLLNVNSFLRDKPVDIVEAIRRVVDGQHLNRAESQAVMENIMSGNATDAQIAAFLTGLRMKGETVDELIGFARVIRIKASPVRPQSSVVAALSGTEREMLVDTCGTGGDASGTFNISTATAFVVAGAGVRVAKHGNRSVSSICGSADVVEALGIRIDLTPESVARCIDEVGIGFLYAPLLHSAMRYVMLARREMKIRTIFNLLGPLCNPACATAQVLGVYHEKLTEMLAQVLLELGTRRAFVVHGSDGLDEITITGESKLSEVRDGDVPDLLYGARRFRFTPGVDGRYSGRRRAAQRRNHSRDPFRNRKRQKQYRTLERSRGPGRRRKSKIAARRNRPGANLHPVRSCAVSTRSTHRLFTND